MITTEDIAIRVYQKLKDSTVSSFITGTVGYARIDYSKEDIIIIPHEVDGEGSRRFGAIKVNIHVPDLNISTVTNPTYIANRKRLLSIRKEVVNVLKRHYESEQGYNWEIEGISPTIKEQGHNEHFTSIHLSITIRKRNFK